MDADGIGPVSLVNQTQTRLDQPEVYVQQWTSFSSHDDDDEEFLPTSNDCIDIKFGILIW